MILEEINFCPRCGTALSTILKFGRERPSCPNCSWIYFADPRVAAAVLVEQNGKILLVRRVHNPQRGKWTLPSGFVDAEEDPADAAVRECLEETGLQVRIVGLLDVIAGQAHPRGAHILIVYRAEVVGGELCAGDDADQAAFFSRDSLPALAFESTIRILS